MAVKAPPRERIQEEHDVWVAGRALTFEEYLHTYEGSKEHTELVKGVPTTRMAANIAHEKLFGWIYMLFGMFVEAHDLGVIFGSRTAVRVTDYDGRLPDILFVRKDRLDIIDSLKLNGPPDLVVELISPGDRRSERMELEADYRSIGVPEIVFVDLSGQSVQTFHKEESDYRIDDLKTGILRLTSVPGLWMDLDWLFQEPRPPVHEALSWIGRGA